MWWSFVITAVSAGLGSYNHYHQIWSLPSRCTEYPRDPMHGPWVWQRFCINGWSSFTTIQAHQSRAHYVLHTEESKPTTSCTGSPSTPRGGCRFIAAQPSVWKFGRTAGKIQWVIPVNWKYSYETIVATSGWWRQYVAVVQLSGGQVAGQARGLKVGNSMPRRPWRQMAP